MPTTDDYGQGVQIAALTDAPNGPRLARDLADGLVPRSAMRFASSAERNATLASPAFGMLASTQAERQLTWYDGTQWVTVGTGAQDWADVPITSDWTQGADGAPALQYRVVNLLGEGALMFRGCISRATWPTDPSPYVSITGLDAGLPAAARPVALRRMPVACSAVGSAKTVIRVDVRPSGEMRLYDVGTNVRPQWISFDGVFTSL